MSGLTDPAATLRRRAALLAVRPQEPDSSPRRELLLVAVDGRRLGLDLARVQRVLPNPGLCRLPASSGELLGLIHAGDAVVPVADLGSVLSGRRLHDRGFVVVVAGTSPAVGFLVDAAEGVISVPEHTLLARDITEPAASGLERAITPQGVVLLDADLLLTDPRLTTARHQVAGTVHANPEQETHAADDYR